MAEILINLSASALAAANKANLYSFFRYFEHSSIMEFANLDGFARWCSPHPYFWFNSVLCSHDATSADNTLVDETLAYFKSKKVKNIGWWLEEGVSRASWENLLAPRGFKFLDGPPGMGVDLDKLPKSIPTPSGLEIQIIKDAEALHMYAHLLTTVNGFLYETESAAYDWALGLGLEMPYISYMAYLNGKPVGTSAIYYGSGVAGIYNVTILPEARGKGIGATVTLKPLLDAHKMGYRAGILQSSEIGFKVYQRLGFQQNCRLGCYYYKFV